MEREQIKQASRELLAELRHLIAPLEQRTEKEQTQAEVEVFIFDHAFMFMYIRCYLSLPIRRRIRSRSPSWSIAISAAKRERLVRLGMRYELLSASRYGNTRILRHVEMNGQNYAR